MACPVYPFVRLSRQKLAEHTVVMALDPMAGPRSIPQRALGRLQRQFPRVARLLPANLFAYAWQHATICTGSRAKM
jgi:hypothetical protein